MCGFSGFIGDSVGARLNSLLPALADAIRYRGRDQEGLWSEDGVVLQHSRLSVIDLVAGRQPMADAGDRYVIVFNGEIYNYLELREAYARQGAVFQTASDTEVVLEGYRLKGAAVCGDLNGMFSFAIWDRRDRSLFLARDHLGKKPLFWTLHDGLVCFSSTLDTFRAIPGWDATLSREAIAVYGHLGAFPESLTIYRRAHAIPPATWARLEFGATVPVMERYWRMSFGNKVRGALDDHLAAYELLLSDSIRLRLRSDVPAALTFSGGVDSGTIASLCAEKLGADLQCYTVDYHTDEDPSEETLIAREVAAHLGLKWTHVNFDYHRDMLRDLSETYRYFDQPCNQFGLVYSHRLYKAIKPYATVVLSGNGADELFTGYIGDEKVRQKGLVLDALAWARPLFRQMDSLSPFLRMPLIQAFQSQLCQQIQASDPGADMDFIRSLLGDIFIEAMEAGAESALDLKMFLALKYRTADSNYRIPDITGLSAQVEVRSPYLDYRMVEFAARLPHCYKIGRLFSPAGNKFLPKRYYERHVPKGVAWSRKKGMGWNVRFDRSIAHDEAFLDAFGKSYARLEDFGIPPGHFREAWQRNVAQTRAGKHDGNDAIVMMNGFMLGVWLDRPVPASATAATQKI